MDAKSSTRDFEADNSLTNFLMMEVSDDEETIDREEALEPELDPQEELKILASDLDVSVEELKSQCESHRSKRVHKKVDYAKLEEEMRNERIVLGLKQPKASDICQASLKKIYTVSEASGPSLNQPISLVELCQACLEKCRITEVSGPSNSPEDDHSGPSNSPEDDHSELTKFYLISSLFPYEDEDGDLEYTPMLKPKFAREIRTGPSYQAEVPEEVSEIWSNAENEHRDKLMWSPPPDCSEDDIQAYLCQVNSIVQEFHPTPASSDRDNELALKILLQCNFNEQLALDKFKQEMHDYVIQKYNEGKIHEKKELNTDGIKGNNEKATCSRKETIEKESSDEDYSPPTKVVKKDKTEKKI